MRLLIFVLTTVLAASAFSAEPILGTLQKVSGRLYLEGDEFCERYVVEAHSNEALNQLQKLASGDEVTASGTKNKTTCTVSVGTIDYVGLRRMLGTWYSKEGMISIRDFSQMSFYPSALDNYSGESQSSAKIIVDIPVVYSYSVTPTDGKEWVVFLSDSKNTFFATILFTKGPAIMKIFDSENGALTKTLRLSKWGSGSR